MTDDEFLAGVLPAALGTPAKQLKLEPELVPAAAIPGYSPEAMVELMIAKPQYTPTQLASHFGRSLSWFSSVLASEAFQSALAPHKDKILDPYLTASMDERFRALALQSLSVISTKLDGKEVTEFLATKAAEIGVKALGLGNQAPALPPPPATPTGADAVAERILAAMEAAKARAKGAAIDVQSREVPSNGS